jgi:hypothetical protein
MDTVTADRPKVSDLTRTAITTSSLKNAPCSIFFLIQRVGRESSVPLALLPCPSCLHHWVREAGLQPNDGREARHHPSESAILKSVLGGT